MAVIKHVPPRLPKKSGCIVKTTDIFIAPKFGRFTESHYLCTTNTGEIVRNLTMDGVHDMRGDYIVFTMGNKYGMMNTDGEMLIKPSFDWVATSGGIILASIDKAGQYLIFDQNAQEVKTLEGLRQRSSAGS